MQEGNQTLLRTLCRNNSKAQTSYTLTIKHTGHFIEVHPPNGSAWHSFLLYSVTSNVKIFSIMAINCPCQKMFEFQQQWGLKRLLTKSSKLFHKHCHIWDAVCPFLSPTSDWGDCVDLGSQLGSTNSLFVTAASRLGRTPNTVRNISLNNTTQWWQQMEYLNW